MNRLQIGQESIQFQNGNFFKELTAVCDELKGLPKAKLADAEQTSRFSAVIKHYTGLSIAIDMNQGFGPAIDIPTLNKNNVLVNSFIRNAVPSADGIRMIAQAGGIARGKVNLRTGKVDGIYCDFNSLLYMPLEMFAGNLFSPEEIAGVMLHEIGHVFTFCEYMGRTVTTNQALAGLAKELDKSGTVEEREAVLVSVKKALGLPELDAKALAQSSDKKAIAVVVVSNIATQAESEIGSNIYDFNTWEYLSDQFAARHGAGRYVVTALDKLYRSSFHISFRSTATYIAMEALKATLALSTLFMVALGGPGFWGGFLTTLFISMDGMGDGTYDRPGARFKRIRNQIVEALKDDRVTEIEAHRYTEDLMAIDEVLANVNDREQWFGKVWNLFSKNARKRLSQEALAKELEAISANELYVQSVKLRQVANQV